MTRSTKSASRTPRRQFIGELATTAAALAAAACAPAATAAPSASQAPAPAAPVDPAPGQQVAPASPTKWDTSWMDRITGKHRAVFDSPDIDDGVALYHAMLYLRAVKDVFGTGDADASVVVVLRHLAVPLLYNDAMWAKYDIGAETKTMDEKTKKPVSRNVYYEQPGARGDSASGSASSATIRSLSGRGVIFVGCDLATRGFSYRAARKAKRDSTSVYEEIKRNLVPGATLMPTGVFATLLAQEAGCSFMKSA